MKRSLYLLVMIVLDVPARILLAAAPATQPIAPTTQPGFARQILTDALNEIHQAKTVVVSVQQTELTSTTQPIVNLEHQADCNYITRRTFNITIEHPGKLRSEIIASDRSSIEQCDGKMITFINLPSRPGEKAYSVVTDTDGTSAEQCMALRGCFTRLIAPQLGRLFDGISDAGYFEYCDDWTWIGAGRDDMDAVWRIAFTDPDGPHCELWITQTSPRRVTRIVMDEASSMGIEGIKPGVTGKAMDDPRNVIYTSYATHRHVEYSFAGWQFGTPIPAGRFDLPAADLHRHELDLEPAQLIGEQIAPEALRSLDDHPVDLTKHDGPIVLEFWERRFGPSIVQRPELGKLLVDYAARGVPIYAVNSFDSISNIKKYLDEKGLKNLTVLTDPTRENHDAFAIRGASGVIVLDATNKVIYGGDAYTIIERRRLADVLEQVAPKK